jgi:predicted nucleotide-binding protein
MAELQALRHKIAKKRNVGPERVARLIRQKAKDTLFTQRLATLAVAHENGIGIGSHATPEELGQLRESQRIGEGSGMAPKLAPPVRAPRASPTTKRQATPRVGTKPKPKPVSTKAARPETRARRVIVAYGRNEDVRKDMFRFLRALDLLPLEWSKAILETGKGSPTITEILDALFAKAVAVVVLMTPDELVTLAKYLQKPTDPPYDKASVAQARPNVFFEAGLAFARFADSTVVVQVGKVKVPTDIDRHVTRLTNSHESRHELMTKLKAAGLDVDTDGSEWLSEGDFERKELYG